MSIDQQNQLSNEFFESLRSAGNVSLNLLPLEAAVIANALLLVARQHMREDRRRDSYRISLAEEILLQLPDRVGELVRTGEFRPAPADLERGK